MPTGSTSPSSTRTSPSQDSEFSEYEQSESSGRQPRPLGGPMKKDRAWFFVGYRVLARRPFVPGQRPDRDADPVPGSLRPQALVSLQRQELPRRQGRLQRLGLPGRRPASSLRTSATAGEVGDDTVWGLNYQSVFSDRTFFEARYAGWKSNDDNVSQTGSTEPAFIDFSPPGGGPTTYTGGVWYPVDLRHLDRSVQRQRVALRRRLHQGRPRLQVRRPGEPG